MKRLFLFVFVVAAILTGGIARAQETTEAKATIVNLFEEVTDLGEKTTIIEVRTNAGDEYVVNSSEAYLDLDPLSLHEGDRVLVQVIKGPDGLETAYISDVVRTPMLLLILLVFFGITLLVGWLRGLLALFGLVVTIGALFLFILPQIFAGHDPVAITVIGGAFILGLNMHLVHGFHRKTFFAFLSTVCGLFLVIVFLHTSLLCSVDLRDWAQKRPHFFLTKQPRFYPSKDSCWQE